MTLARMCLGVACAVLPRHSRERYWREFVAELRDVHGWRRTAYVAGVLVSAPALRRALSEPGGTVHGEGRPLADLHVGSAPPPISMRAFAVPPDPDLIAPRLRCALGLRHAWARFSTTDGEAFKACRECGLVATGPLRPRGARSVAWWGAGGRF